VSISMLRNSVPRLLVQRRYLVLTGTKWKNPAALQEKFIAGCKPNVFWGHSSA
jgi:hypothetical protein